MIWLITGGSGYIGSHIIHELLDYGYHVINLDTTPADENKISRLNCLNIQGDIRDLDLINTICEESEIDGIINCAALKSVPESFLEPEKYLEINYQAAKDLLNIGIKKNVKFFVQSSTAAVYGPDVKSPMAEDSILNPVSPYGQSKLKFEKEIANRVALGEISGTSLRYFNVAGSRSRALIDLKGKNLISTVIKSVKQGQAPVIFGNEFKTKDGTCIRDFIDVRDVATAHRLVVEKLISGNALSSAINIGTGLGNSVSEIVSEILTQLGSNLTPRILEAREGDLPEAVGDVRKAFIELGFRSKFSLAEMISTSLN